MKFSAVAQKGKKKIVIKNLDSRSLARFCEFQHSVARALETILIFV